PPQPDHAGHHDGQAGHEDADLPAEVQPATRPDELRRPRAERPLLATPVRRPARRSPFPSVRPVGGQGRLTALVTPRVHTVKHYPSYSHHRNGRTTRTISRPDELHKRTQNTQRGLQRHRRWHVDFADVRIPERTLSERPWRL